VIQNAKQFELSRQVTCKPLTEWNSIAVELLGTQTRMVQGTRWRHRVIEAGTGGEPLILLHGIGGHAETYARNLRTPIDHVMVTAGRPYYALLADIDVEEASRSLDDHQWLAIRIARLAVGKVRPGGSLVFVGGTGGRRPGPGRAVIAMGTAALPALVATLAVEVAPIRVNLVAPGFVDTALSASLLGDDLDQRRDQLRATLPIGRVVQPADVAALAVHLMSNTALTGATYDVDGGQQHVPE